MPDGGTLEIEASNIIVDKIGATTHPGLKIGTYVSVSVRDSGIGIPEETLKHVFDPFFTTKAIGSGTGLGLSMAYGFAKQSGGHVTIQSRVGQGTRVTLYIPSTLSAQRKVHVKVETPSLQGGGESILLVEDEPAVLKLVSNILRSLGYQITEAASGDEAIKLLRKIEPPDLLLSDVVLPGKHSGHDLATFVKNQCSQTKVLLMSGYSPELAIQDGGQNSAHELLQKPFRATELTTMVRAILDSRSPSTGRDQTQPSAIPSASVTPPS
jgi:hypothetical protein